MHSIFDPKTPFALFAYRSYVPYAGFRDFVGTFNTQKEAEEKGREMARNRLVWCYVIGSWHVVDLRTLKIVAADGPKEEEMSDIRRELTLKEPEVL